MNDNDADQALEIIESYGLRPGKNWKLIFVELISDISARDGIRSADILKMPEIITILSDEKESSPKKMEKLKDALSKMRYPKYSRSMERFKALQRDLSLPASVKIIPTPYFESRRLKIEIMYDHEKGLEREIEAIKRLSRIDLVGEALETEEDNN